MPIHITTLSSNLAGRPEMRNIFCASTRVANFLRIEVALAKVEASLGIIPQSAYAEIDRRASGLQVNWDRLRREFAAGGHPALLLIQQLGEACGGASEYLHWGSTARQVSDTAFVLQLREGMALIERDARQLRGVLQRMSQAYQSAVMVPRRSGPPSAPTTFGFRCAVWCSEIDRQIARLVRVRLGLAGDSFGAPDGLGPQAGDVRTGLMHELGLAPIAVPGYGVHDRICDCAFALATLSSVLAGMAATVASMADGRVQELRTPLAAGATSGFAQVCEQVLAYAAKATENVTVALEAALCPHDAERQHALETELVPQTFLLVHGAVVDVAEMLAGLEVFPSRMRTNIDGTKGLVMAENVMQMLAVRSGRRSAHRLVTRACESALREDISLREALLRNRDVTALVSPDEIDRALDPVAGRNGVPRPAVPDVNDDGEPDQFSFQPALQRTPAAAPRAPAPP